MQCNAMQYNKIQNETIQYNYDTKEIEIITPTSTSGHLSHKPKPRLLPRRIRIFRVNVADAFHSPDLPDILIMSQLTKNVGRSVSHVSSFGFWSFSRGGGVVDEHIVFVVVIVVSEVPVALRVVQYEWRFESVRRVVRRGVNGTE